MQLLNFKSKMSNTILMSIGCTESCIMYHFIKFITSATVQCCLKS